MISPSAQVQYEVFVLKDFSRLYHVKEMVTLSQEPLLLRVLQIEEESFSVPWTTAEFQLAAADVRAVNLGLWRGERLAGYAIAFDEAGELHLASLAIEESHRRQGWGSHLLRQVLARAAERGCRSCRLEVRESNRPALELYRRHAFEVTGAKRRFYTGPVEDAVVMVRQLSSPCPEVDGGPTSCKREPGGETWR